MKKNEKIKELHGDDRIQLKDHIPLENPLAIFMEPSSACNLECVYCPHSIGKKRFESEVRPFHEIEFPLFERIVDQIQEFGVPMKLIELSGIGEPFYNKNLPDMIRLLKEKQVTNHIRMITNATMLTPEKMDSVVAAGVDSVRISLQGLSDESYKKITGVDISFEKVIQNIQYFYEHRGNTQIFLKNINIALKTEEEKEAFIEKYSNIADRIFVENIVAYFNNVDYSELVEDDTQSRYSRTVQKVDVCPYIFTGLDLNMRGDISVCGQIEKPVLLGNVKDITLKEAWNGQARRDFLLMQLEKRRYENPVCNRCKVPGISLASETDLLDQDAEEIIRRFF